jgi:hypothetical protein
MTCELQIVVYIVYYYKVGYTSFNGTLVSSDLFQASSDAFCRSIMSINIKTKGKREIMWPPS